MGLCMSGKQSEKYFQNICFRTCNPFLDALSLSYQAEGNTEATEPKDQTNERYPDRNPRHLP